MKDFLKKSVAKLLISYLGIIILTLIFVSIGFHFAFKIVKSNLQDTNLSRLDQSANVIESQLEDMEIVALQMSQATNILDMAGKSKGDSSYISVAVNALDDFSLYQNYKTINLFKNTQSYIFFRKTQLVLFNSSYYQTDVFQKYVKDWGEDYYTWLEIMNDPNFVTPRFQCNGDSFEYAFPFSKYLFGEREGVIVLRVDKDAVLASMLDINVLSDNRYFMEIRDADGNLLWNASTIDEDRIAFSSNDLTEEYSEINGLSVMKTTTEHFGWTYVLAIPVNDTLLELRELKNSIFLLMFIALALAAFQAVFYSVKTGKPIDKAIEDAKRNRFSLQKNFFDNLLKAEYTSEAEITAQANNVGLNIENQMYQTAYIKFFAEDDFGSLDGKTMDEIRQLSQCVKDHFRKKCGAVNVWFHKKNYNSEIAIFAVDELDDDVIDIVNEAREWLIKNYNVDFISGIGGTCANLTLIWRSVEEAVIALNNCTRENAIISYKPEMIDANAFYFPAIAADKLQECLGSGQWQDAKTIIALIETENTQNRHLRRKQFIKLNQRVIECIHDHVDNEELENKMLWLNEVMLGNEIDQKEYFIRLNRLARDICNEHAEKKQEQKGQLVEEIKEYINNHYYEPDMGLSKVGSQFHVSETYLSTVFKEQSGGNFADYIEKLRIDKAYELLQANNMTVNDISLKVGYNSVQSFRRAFKRVMGVSPKEIKGTVQ